MPNWDYFDFDGLHEAAYERWMETLDYEHMSQEDRISFDGEFDAEWSAAEHANFSTEYGGAFHEFLIDCGYEDWEAEDKYGIGD